MNGCAGHRGACNKGVRLSVFVHACPAQGDGGSTSTGSRAEHTRAAIISVETDHTQRRRSWQYRHAFYIYCVSLFLCL